METFAEALSVMGAMLLSVSCGLLLEELLEPELLPELPEDEPAPVSCPVVTSAPPPLSARVSLWTPPLYQAKPLTGPPSVRK